MHTALIEPCAFPGIMSVEALHNHSRRIDTGAPEGYADADQRLSRLMMLLWTNFAKYG